MLALVLAACTATPEPSQDATDDTSGPLHVPSPDWRDQVIYFAMIDRFDDGDPSNNDQGAGEFDPSSGAHYSGGDLAGLTRRLDYIQGLGATALWITPPVAHQWWDGRAQYGGYHGYWAENFVEVDAHFGTLGEYRALSRALHGRGMVLVQDVVVNHVGNFFGYAEPPPPDAPAQGYVPSIDVRPRAAPTQWPFSLNDPRRDADREAAIYHWTPDIADFTDPVQERDWQLAGLDDLNTDNATVQRALRESYTHWIREAGVDAFRVDTAFYVAPEFFDGFMRADDAQAPGMSQVAAATGRDDFFAFGEGFGIDRPFEDAQARRIESYVRDAAGSPLLPGMINFPLYGSTLDVFARGRPTAVLGHRIRSMMAVHADPHRLATFVDNHDVDRFLAGGSEAALRQALLMLMTLPGIPVVYYGTEQGFVQQRAAMFAGGHGSDGRDRFDTQAPLYRYLQRAIALRREHRVLSRGVPRVIAENAAAPGVLGYTMRDGDAVMLVLLNSAASPSLLAGVDAGLPRDAVLTPVFSVDGEAPVLSRDASGRLSAVLPSHGGAVWRVEPANGDAGERGLASVDGAARITFDPPSQAVVTGDLVVSGTVHGLSTVAVVVDGDIARATQVPVARDGRWSARVDTADFVDPQVQHTVVAWSSATGVVSPAHTVRVARAWQARVARDDPAGDDHGPNGQYDYPRDASWQGHRSLDLRRVALSTSGASLRIELTLADIVAFWNAPNGFDHLALTVFIELPGRDDGATVMPLQNATLPDGMRWHRRLRVGGWTSALFDADGAGEDEEGRRVPNGAALTVERDANRIVLTLPASALGNPATLDGARVFVTTWDYDGGYRGLLPEAGSHAFGGGDAARDPLWMDASEVLVVPNR